VTIVGSQFLVTAVVTGVARLPFWPRPDRLTTGELQDLARVGDNLPFQGFHFQIGDLPLQFGFNHIFTIELAVLALVAVGFFLRYTRAGTAVRAMAANPERASLLGIGVGGLSIVVWTIAGALDGVGAILASASSPAAIGGGGGGFTFATLLAPLAAGVLGRFRNLGTAIFSAIAIGVVGEAFRFSFPEDTELFTVALFAVVAVGLLVQRRALSRTETGVSVSWSATQEPRPIPKELSHVTSLRIARLSLIALGAVIVVALPFILPIGRTNFAGVIIVNAIAVLSLVVLTGWAGQVSLGQFALVGVGAVVGGALTSRVGVPFWFAVPITVAVTAAVAVVVGLPALRIKGLFLLVTTFAFAVAVSATLFNTRYFGWLLPEQVDRPTLFFFNFEDERSMYYLCVAGLAISILAVVNLRRSRIGRLLIAMRESEANVQAFGISVVRMKMLAFAISGGMAGFAGILFAHHQRGVSAASFAPNGSVGVFIAAVIGGVSSPGGALLGASYTQIIQELSQGNELIRVIFSGAFPILILFLAPGGLISLVNSARDSVLRVIAQRRRIVVPSLFADYDPDALARQLIPFGDPDPNSGLAAIPSDRRYMLRSELYKGKGERIIDRLGPKQESREAVAMGAAARRVEELAPAPDVEHVGEPVTETVS
jgi:branched-chain amino acid transport system permease protein